MPMKAINTCTDLPTFEIQNSYSVDELIKRHGALTIHQKNRERNDNLLRGTWRICNYDIGNATPYTKALRSGTP